MTKEKLWESQNLRKGVSCLLRAQPLSVFIHDIGNSNYVAVKPKIHNDDCMMTVGWTRQANPYPVAELDCYKTAKLYFELSDTNHLSLSHDFLQAQLRKIIPLEIYRYCKGVLIQREKVDYAGKVNFNNGKAFVPVRIKLMFRRTDAEMVRAIRDTTKHAA
jgi:hypothetical protein